MTYNEHSRLAGTHALLSASKYYWLNYSDEDIQRAYISSYSQRIGTLIHELAASLIKHRIRVNKTDKHLLLHHLLSMMFQSARLMSTNIFRTLLPTLMMQFSTI